MHRAFALTVAVAALTSCGGEEGSGPSGAASDTIEIAATDFAFEPAAVEVDSPGTYAFRLVNNGEFPHALEIEGAGVEVATAEVGPGASAEVTVELAAGSYELYCPVGNHREQGMEGTVSVGGAAPGGGGTTTREDDGSYDY